jgi:cytoskeletal protein RodZ
MLDDIDLEGPLEEAPKGSRNGRFVVIAGVLGAILLLALIAVAVYALVILPAQQAAEPDQDTALSVQETGTALALAAQATDTAPAPAFTNTPGPTAIPSDTPTATEITPIFTSAAGGATQTVQALLTEAASAQTEAAWGGTAVVTATSTPSALAETGLADEFGLPGLMAATGLLLAVIFFARRWRIQAY